MSFRELLARRNYTQSKLIKGLKELNCKSYQQQVSEWVNGKKIPNAFSVWCISKVLGVSTDVVIEASLKSAGRI